jgi:hypothetical protein
MNEKKKYKCTFNWKGEIHKFYRWANNPIHASHLAFIQLAEDLKISPYVVRQYYILGNRNNFSIVLEEEGKNVTIP